jgi:hypothetical protein
MHADARRGRKSGWSMRSTIAPASCGSLLLRYAKSVNKRDLNIDGQKKKDAEGQKKKTQRPNI